MILIGIALTFRFFTQEQQLDKDVFIETTESIRNLQSLDKGLLLLLYQSRYNSEFDNDELADTNLQISEEFDNLRYEALFNEIENNEGIQKATVEFDENFRSRQELLAQYIESNTTISNALIDISIRTYQLTEEANVENNNTYQTVNFQALLGKINAIIFDLVIGEELKRDELIADREEFIKLGSEVEFLNPDQAKPLAEKFVQNINDILNNYQTSNNQFDELNSLKSSQLLNTIEDRYTSYHNNAITQSNQFRNALLIYGLCLLVVLLFFAWQIRKNYLFLGQQVAERTQEIKLAYDDLQESQEQLIQSEKMASLGQMVAGVAHEINTPLGYVTSNIDILKVNFEDVQTIIKMLGATAAEAHKKDRDNKLISRQISNTLKTYKSLDAEVLAEESVQLLSDGAYGLEEISKLVTSLKDFARLDRQNTEQIDINNCLDSSVTIASNHIKENNITLIKEYSELPKITCFPSKLNQLFLNIITNACQAMKDHGDTLTISTHKSGEGMIIRFQDQGCGMDEETQQKMFDPFFTSKDIGQGTGLGLSIAYKIIEAHNGSINVESKINEGTMIEVYLPYKSKND